MYWVLYCRLRAGQATAFQYVDDFFLLFTKFGVWKVPSNLDDAQGVFGAVLEGKLVALVDFNGTTVSTPAPSIYLVREFFPVVVVPPWIGVAVGQSWEHVRRPRVLRFWFNPFDMQETLFGFVIASSRIAMAVLTSCRAGFQRKYTGTPLLLRLFFEWFGPSAQVAYLHCSAMETYKRQLGEPLRAMSSEPGSTRGPSTAGSVAPVRASKRRTPRQLHPDESVGLNDAKAAIRDITQGY